ncbi:MAG TPA: phosphonoacetaldehyde reductase [Ignavibacteria bacterium]|nr:phosphonoacetaldehyde reductase [Ignavibacteria bacterium]
MKIQEEYFETGSIGKLKDILLRNSARKIFLVTGKKSFEESGLKKVTEDLTSDFQIFRYSDFSENPKAEDVEKGIELFRNSGCDTIVAAGGGSVIDTGKLINILSAQSESPENYITGKSVISKQGKLFIAIPTTSGAGSEATHFAVVYLDKEKYSLAHEFILPDIVITDPELTFSVPPYVTAVSGIDAFSQAIESYWCINSNKESKQFSSEAIKLIFGNIVSAVKSPSEENRMNMSKAANLSGKAINITKTTAPHAISYSLTSYFGVPHGQAVSLTLGEFLKYNYEVTENDINDKRGVSFVKNTIEEISELLGCSSVCEARDKINLLMREIGLKTKLSETGIVSPENINLILENVNTERLQNNPRSLTRENLNSILKKIL